MVCSVCLGRCATDPARIRSQPVALNFISRRSEEAGKKVASERKAALIHLSAQQSAAIALAGHVTHRTYLITITFHRRTRNTALVTFFRCIRIGGEQFFSINDTFELPEGERWIDLALPYTVNWATTMQKTGQKGRTERREISGVWIPFDLKLSSMNWYGFGTRLQRTIWFHSHSRRFYCWKWKRRREKGSRHSSLLSGDFSLLERNSKFCFSNRRVKANDRKEEEEDECLARVFFGS